MSELKPWSGDSCLWLLVDHPPRKLLKTTFRFCLDYVPCHLRGWKNDKADGVDLHTADSLGGGGVVGGSGEGSVNPAETFECSKLSEGVVHLQRK